MKINAAIRLNAAAPHDMHLEKIVNALNHSGIKGAIDSDGQEIVITTQKPFNTHALSKFAREMHIDIEHITIQAGRGGVELRVPSFVVGK